MATSQPPPSTKPYRHFYTPFLHSKFFRVVVGSSVVCFLEAALLGEWTSFWNWTPFSTTPLRALLILVPVLALLIVRVSTLHFGSRTTATRVGTAAAALLDVKTYETIFWHTFSAWFFVEIYIWSCGPAMNLGLVDSGRSYEPDRFNERPVFLRSAVILVGAAQACIHLFLDSSCIDIKLPSTSSSTNTPQPTTPAQPPAAPTPAELLGKIQSYTLPVLLDASFRASVAALTIPLFYFMILRHLAWRISISFYGNFIEIPKRSRLSVVPTGLVDLVVRLFFISLLLFTLWGVTNAIFSRLLAANPLKKGRPLTDRSQDPNGSLLAGLKAQKPTIKIAALRELNLIIERFPERRQSLFRDVERKDGLVFNQILDVTLGELHALTKRIQDYRFPHLAVPPPEDIKRLPHIAPPLKQEPIFKPLPRPTTTSETLESAIGSFAKSRGSHPGQQDPISPRARRLLEKSAGALLSKDQQAKLSLPALENTAGGLLSRLLDSTAGLPFRVRTGRAVDAIAVAERVSAYGYSRAQILVLAVTALSRLASWSLTEDKMGVVARSIPTLFRTYTATAKAIEDLLSGRAHDGPCDTLLVLESLRAGLKIVMADFGAYRSELGIGEGEWSAAGAIVGRADESARQKDGAVDKSATEGIATREMQQLK